MNSNFGEQEACGNRKGRVVYPLLFQVLQTFITIGVRAGVAAPPVLEIVKFVWQKAHDSGDSTCDKTEIKTHTHKEK